jgi:type I restriction enzyme S subunit
LLEEKAYLRYKQIVKEEKFHLKAFNEVADYVNGYPFKPDHWKEEGLPIIKIKELKGGIQNDTPRNDGENIPDKYFIENKDILFAWSASIGVYLWSYGKSILNQHIFNVKPFDRYFHNWLYFSLLEKIPDFINMSNGATMQHIKKSALGMVYLPVPQKRVYEEFQEETELILNLIVNLNQQNTKLREARDILLPRLMSGEIEV